MRKIKVQTLGNLPMVAVMVSREVGFNEMIHGKCFTQ